jgi:hypothetical protein
MRPTEASAAAGTDGATSTKQADLDGGVRGAGLSARGNLTHSPTPSLHGQLLESIDDPLLPLLLLLVLLSLPRFRLRWLFVSFVVLVLVLVFAGAVIASAFAHTESFGLLGSESITASDARASRSGGYTGPLSLPSP